MDCCKTLIHRHLCVIIEISMLATYIDMDEIPYTMKVSRQKSFVVFTVFTWSAFLYESSRWRCSNVDLRESMWDSASFFANVCVYSLLRNFSASKLLWYTVMIICEPGI